MLRVFRGKKSVLNCFYKLVYRVLSGAVCFGKSLVLKAKRGGSNPVYCILGQTHAGRYLFCVVIHFSDGNGFPVTARQMSENEKKTILVVEV